MIFKKNKSLKKYAIKVQQEEDDQLAHELFQIIYHLQTINNVKIILLVFFGLVLPLTALLARLLNKVTQITLIKFDFLWFILFVLLCIAIRMEKFTLKKLDILRKVLHEKDI